MGEKRKPIFVFLLKIPSKKKTHKVEVFSANDFKLGYYNRFRLRVNGKWFGEKGVKYHFFGLYEIRDIIWRSIKRHFYPE